MATPDTQTAPPVETPVSRGGRGEAAGSSGAPGSRAVAARLLSLWLRVRVAAGPDRLEGRSWSAPCRRPLGGRDDPAAHTRQSRCDLSCSWARDVSQPPGSVGRVRVCGDGRPGVLGRVCDRGCVARVARQPRAAVAGDGPRDGDHRALVEPFVVKDRLSACACSVQNPPRPDRHTRRTPAAAAAPIASCVHLAITADSLRGELWCVQSRTRARSGRHEAAK
jgi:hypothetical protein